MSTTTNPIKSKYPNPQTVSSARALEVDESKYCVGGALCRFIYDELKTPPRNKHSLGFPTYGEISEAVRLYALAQGREPIVPITIVRDLVANNDHGSFERAYDKALELLKGNKP